MKNLFLTILLFCIWLVGLVPSSAQRSLMAEAVIPEKHLLIPDFDIQDRLNAMPSRLIDHQFNNVVRSYIATYTVKNRERTEEMLSKMALYFPIFEQILAEEGLPTDLKYLSILESALDPLARSRSGAMGLWQFMPPTGREWGLRIGRTIDERKDPVKATRAAAKYLKRIYKKFGDWELTLAAYNGGPGRVSRALKKSGATDFWSVAKHLPRETRNYVSAYTGATYIANYYNEHNLVPSVPIYNFGPLETFLIKDDLPFDELASYTGMSVDEIKYFNPSYNRKDIPNSKKGYLLSLPQGPAEVFNNRLKGPSRNHAFNAGWMNNSEYDLRIYSVDFNDNIENVASSFKVDLKDIIRWNNLIDFNIRSGQELKIFTPKKVVKNRNFQETQELWKKSHGLVKPTKKWSSRVEHIAISPTKIVTGPRLKKKFKKGNATFHILQFGETLTDIARQYDGVEYDDLIKWNKVNKKTELQVGQRIQISK